MQADATEVFLDLTEGFAESLTHRPLNNSANNVAVTGVFAEQEPSPRFDEQGDEVERTATIEIDDSVSVDMRDRWIRNSIIWAPSAISVAQGGMRRVELSVKQAESTRDARGRLV